MDIEIVKKAKKGNKKAFDSIIKEVSLDGYRLAYYYLNHQADSQDVVSTSIEKAYKKITSLNDLSKFKSWFLSIVSNESKILLRRKKYKNEIITQEQYEDINITYDINPELRLDMQKLLKSLDPDDRTLILLKYYEGYTFKEIAKILIIPESTVKTRTYKLLNTLKKKLNEGGKSYVIE